MWHGGAIPEQIDVLVIGGGTSGAALAGIVARDTSRNVLLLEAGPDYGALADGRWPADLLEARTIPLTHNWGYEGIAHAAQMAPIPYSRARVIGGCSAHNGCVALLGHRRDYDHWAELGNTGWDWESVAPAFERAKRGLRVREVADEELTPFHRAFVEGAVAAGIPRSIGMNDPRETEGVAGSPVNVHDGMRWNTALGYLDPVRGQSNLTVIGNALVDCIETRDGRAIAAHAIIDGDARRIAAGRIVLSAGAYGSPGILLRSGIGPADELRALGIQAVHDLPGVGRALADHPAAGLIYRGSDRLDAEMDEFERTRWTPDEQALLKTRSGRCKEAFDLHLFSVIIRDPDTGERGYWVSVSSVAPKSVGTVRLASTDPAAAPLIDHGYLTDDAGDDLEALLDGIRLGREIMAPSLASGLLAEEVTPGPGAASRAELIDFIERTVGIYYHPTSTCRMGPATDAGSVVNADGKLHGLDGLYVCDASIFPVIMRANTNLPAAMVAEHLAERIGS
ncbi:MAG TPA: GMC oxidoreductase [Thermomicrobiales bacterium]|nr:GMC oxidoreductase [Thermomicrobiales bacterium]